MTETQPEEAPQGEGPCATPSCRICCSGDDTDDSPLFSGVCRCRGSLATVHARCLVKWQLMRRSNQWICELCGANLRWPADETLRLVQLLSELAERRAPPPPLLQARQRRQRHRDQLPPPEAPRPPPRPSTWARLKLGMSRRMRSMRKSVLQAARAGGRDGEAAA